MDSFTLKPGLASVFLPGVGHARRGVVIHGAHLRRFVPQFLAEVAVTETVAAPPLVIIPDAPPPPPPAIEPVVLPVPVAVPEPIALPEPVPGEEIQVAAQEEVPEAVPTPPTAPEAKKIEKHEKHEKIEKGKKKRS